MHMFNLYYGDYRISDDSGDAIHMITAVSTNDQLVCEGLDSL